MNIEIIDEMIIRWCT